MSTETKVSSPLYPRGTVIQSPRLGRVVVQQYLGAGTVDVTAADGKQYRLSGLSMVQPRER